MQTMAIRNTVLCIDDEEATVLPLQPILMANGYEVLTATDNLRALQLIYGRRVDAIVLIHSGPARSSEEIAAEMKRLRPGTPIILFSGVCDIPSGALPHVDASVQRIEGVDGLLVVLRRLLQLSVNQAPMARKFRRFSVQVPVVVTVIRSGTSIMLEGISRSLGEGGLGGRINGKLLPGEYVRIRIIDRRLETVLEPRAQVRYRKDDNYGFAFLDVSPSEQAGVRRLFSQPALA